MRPTHPRRHSIPAWLLPSLLLSVILSASSLGRAQCYEPPANQAPQVTLSPTYWAPGQTYTVTLSDPQGYFVSYTPSPGFLPATLYVLTAASYDSGIYYAEDPNVTVTNLTLVNSSTITFTATVLGSAPVEADGIGLVCLGYTMTGSPGTIEITPCALPVTPTVSSIVPAAFFANASTNVTLAGTGFIPDGNTYGCVPTQLTVTAGTETVALSNVSVVSPTQITATVAPQATDPIEPATVVAANYVYNGPPYLVNSNPDTAYILPVPSIENSSGETISGASAQTAVVGQTINLSSVAPSASALAALPVPVVFSSNAWTVGGTNIGGYTVVPPTEEDPTTSSATVNPTVLTESDLKTYWTAASTKTPVNYQYCVNIPGLGNTCSPPAKATFNISAPTRVTVSTSHKTFSAIDYPPEKLDWEINFNAQATSPSGYTGVYSWVQIVTSAKDVENFQDGSSKTCTGGPALDVGENAPYYPYAEGLTTNDLPSDELNLPNETGVNDNREFQMYFLWNPQSDANSIPVPLGNITWSAIGQIAYNFNTNTWGEESGNTTAANFATSSSFPLWQTGITGESFDASCQ